MPRTIDRKALSSSLLACSLVACGAAHTAEPVAIETRATAAGVGTGEPIGGDPLDAPASGSCGGLADLGDRPTSLLADRVRVDLPSIADVHGMPHSIMAAERSHEREEMAWIQRGDSRMAVVAVETTVRDTGELASMIAPHAPGGWALLATDDLVVATPETLEERGTDVPLAYAWWRDASGLLVRLDIVTDPRTARTGGCVVLARRIAASIVAGGRAPDLRARTIAITRSISVVIPESYLSTVDEGEDFDVHRFALVSGWADEGAQAWIYVGDHPSFAASPPAAATDVLLGQQVEWFDHTDEDGHHREALIPLGPDGGVLHVFFAATDEATFDALYQSMRTLTARE